MKKQIIYFMLIGWLLPLSVWAQSAPVMGTVLLNGKEIPAEYVVSGSNASLGSSRNACIPQYSEGRVIVPAKISVDGREYNVTAVSNMAFRLCGGITFVQLPEGVKRIGNFAFKSCKGLLDVKLPSTLESIGSGAFVGLTNLRAIYCQAAMPPQRMQERIREERVRGGSEVRPGVDLWQLASGSDVRGPAPQVHGEADRERQAEGHPGGSERPVVDMHQGRQIPWGMNREREDMTEMTESD